MIASSVFKLVRSPCHSWSSLLVIIVWIVCVAPSFVWGGQSDGRLDIFFIDAEVGAATLIVTPVGQSILVDSGYPGHENRDIKRILAVVHDEAHLERIDHAVATHWHLDHYTNHAALSKLIPIGTFWDRGIPDELPEDQNFAEQIAAYRAALAINRAFAPARQALRAALARKESESRSQP